METRRKVKCEECEEIISLLLDDRNPSSAALLELKKDELAEYKCPACGEWACVRMLTGRIGDPLEEEDID